MVFWLIVGAVLLGIFLIKTNKDFTFLGLSKRIKTVNGAAVETVAPIVKGASIFGNNFDLVTLNTEGIFLYNRKTAANIKKSYIQYFIAAPCYNIITAEDAELVFNDMNLITKGVIYRFILPFISTGLLTSTGQKWRSRRKMLTPAFHFNILEQFLDIFKEESEKFKTLIEKQENEVISLTDLIPRVTLNSICETALGVKLDNLKDGDTYRNHLDGIERAMVQRISNPLYINDFIWEHFGNAKEFYPSYEGVHRFSSNIIEKRRAMFQKSESAKQSAHPIDEDNIFFSKKKRYAMLDTLLKAQSEGLIDHQGICEEVDTFIFEGFDTTSMGLIYGIMNLSLYPEIQQKCYEEILSLVDDDLTQLTISQINSLEYLDRFVKENIRMYPSVPVISREAVRETALGNNLLLPKGTQIIIHIYDIHRNPKYFKNPNDFDPDRFLPEHTADRHPYAFVPFSAGSRNCIGQKFAMLEMKTFLVYMLKNFEFLPVENPKELKYATGFLLRVSQNIKVRITKRKK